MLKVNIFQQYCIIVLFIAAFISAPSALFPESIFTRDGSIHEGRIAGSDDQKIKLSLSSGGEIEIARKQIVRVLMHSRFREKIYLTQTDGVTHEGYIVNEDNLSYTLRKVLGSPVEIIIPRDRVETISRKGPSARLIAPTVYSSVFLKDGSIIDCMIVMESVNTIAIQPVEGEKKAIRKADIMRIRYNNSYRDLKIFRKTDGTGIEGYIMEEDSESYIYRRDLYSPAETRIYKSELKSISRR